MEFIRKGYILRLRYLYNILIGIPDTTKSKLEVLLEERRNRKPPKIA